MPIAKLYTYRGRTMTQAEWAKELGINVTSMRGRMNKFNRDDDVCFSNPFLTYQGEKHRVTDWAKMLGITYGALAFRLANWPLHEAMTKPLSNKARVPVNNWHTKRKLQQQKDSHDPPQ